MCHSHLPSSVAHHIPSSNRTILRTRKQPSTILRHRHGIHTTRMPLEYPHAFAPIRHTPSTHSSILRRTKQKLTIRRKHQSVHCPRMDMHPSHCRFRRCGATTSGCRRRRPDKLSGILSQSVQTDGIVAIPATARQEQFCGDGTERHGCHPKRVMARECELRGWREKQFATARLLLSE